MQAYALDEVPALSRPVAARLIRHGFRTVGEIDRTTDEALRGYRTVGWVAIRHVREAIAALRADARSIPVAAKADPGRLREALATRSPFLDVVAHDRAALPRAMRTVLDRRALNADGPESLRAVGTFLGVSGERVRQLERTGFERMVRARQAAHVADDRIGAARRGRTTPLTVADLERGDPWFAGCTRAPQPLRGFLEYLGARHRCVRGNPDADVFVVAELEDPNAWHRWWSGLGLTSEQPAEFRARLAEALASLGAPELVDLVATRLEDELRGPTMVQVVERVLRAARGPLHADEIVARAAALGSVLDVRGAAQCVRALDAVIAAPSTYVLREHLAVWDWLRPAAVEATVRILGRSERRDWSCKDLTDALRAEDGRWPGFAAPHVLDHLLRDAPEVVRHPRGNYELAGRRRGTPRKVDELLLQALVDAGRPLRPLDARRRITATRSVAKSIKLTWPVVGLGDGTWGLADRDLGLAPEGIDDMDRRVRARLDATGAVDAANLTACFAQTWPTARPVEARTIARWMTHRVHAVLDAAGTGLVARGPADRAPASGTLAT